MIAVIDMIINSTKLRLLASGKKIVTKIMGPSNLVIEKTQKVQGKKMMNCDYIA